ncbi:hypothetical protein CKO44_23540 [Rubrivivax gelatinosus]|uniref:Uncharacterized protein n=1 Tax=Rubrivivax gelatinosus TaxID=28068 RepID=A0ABS1DY16_RUBGE|nr:hypothetical protein [Rubrivivax gelatinosus]MBK1616419.1 hypothetical protein [Rubrivivax gelatinosus]MBK1714982.1 hypothetical protein [Rubrivivax gelatinosus]MBZ8142809.1 hypothetical protein [Rubrivivax gelatinosus]
MQQQLVLAFGASVLLEGGLVLITDWLPGLNWRIQVSPQLAEELPRLTVERIWNQIEPYLLCWLDEQADAGIFALPREWGECVLAPAVYQWPPDPEGFTFRCVWSQLLDQGGRQVRGIAAR